MSCSPPPAILSCPINGLADSVLEDIFKRLPLYERLIVSEVCRRWHSICSNAWLDISKIDLTPIPGKHIRAIVKHCTNLQSIYAVNKSFDANELTCLAKAQSLKRVSLFGCDFKLNPGCVVSIEQNIFSDRLENASWTELILHGADFLAPTITADVSVAPFGTAFLFSVAKLPASLTHLQLSGLRLCEGRYSESRLSLDGLERLEHLERFILHSTPHHRNLPIEYYCAHYLVDSALSESSVFEKLIRLKNLEELCLGFAILLSGPTGLIRLASNLPMLQVLFLTHLDGDAVAEDLAEIITTNSALRVLVLSGIFWAGEPIELPARKRFPRGFGSDPLPLLHIFVGKEASEKIRFMKSTSDAAIIHPINQPMPEFLDREDIAPIFEGVWVAKKIKEVAKHNGKLWKYDIHDTGFSIQHA